MIIKLLHLFDLVFKLVYAQVTTLLFKVKLSLRSCSYGKNLYISGKVYLATQKKGALKIGDYFKLNSNPASNLVGISNRASFQIIENGRIEIGNDCGFSSTVLSSRSLIRIGNYVKIGGNVRIFDHDYHSTNYLERRVKKMDSQNCRTKKVIIEDDVFIGTNVIILKGTFIGARSVLSAGSIINGQIIPPDSLVAGNPAQIIKRLT